MVNTLLTYFPLDDLTDMPLYRGTGLPIINDKIWKNYKLRYIWYAEIHYVRDHFPIINESFDPTTYIVYIVSTDAKCNFQIHKSSQSGLLENKRGPQKYLNSPHFLPLPLCLPLLPSETFETQKRQKGPFSSVHGTLLKFLVGIGDCLRDLETLKMGPIYIPFKHGFRDVYLDQKFNISKIRGHPWESIKTKLREVRIAMMM